MNTFVQLPVAGRSPGECWLCSTQKGHPTKGDYKLPVCERLCWRTNLMANIFHYRFNLAQGTFISVSTQESALGTGCSPQKPNPTSQRQSWHTLSLSQAPAFTVQQQAENLNRLSNSTDKMRALPAYSACGDNRKSWMQELPCLNQVVAWRARRLPKLTQENRRWVAPNSY